MNVISKLPYSGLVLLGTSSCYLSYWVIRSWVLCVCVFPPPWWNSYALKFWIIRTAQSDTFFSLRFHQTYSKYITWWWQFFVQWGVHSMSGTQDITCGDIICLSNRPDCGNSLVCCPQSNKIACSHTFGRRYRHFLVDNCSYADIKYHSAGSIFKLGILLPITDQKLKRWENGCQSFTFWFCSVIVC